MIEKICEIINDEYCCDIDITIEEWKQLLNNPTVFDDKSKRAIKKWYIEPRYSATCGYIGKKYNEHSMSANGIINGLAGRVQKELGRFVVKGYKLNNPMEEILFYAVIEKESGRIVGNVGVHNFKVSEVGVAYFVNEDYKCRDY